MRDRGSPGSSSERRVCSSFGLRLIVHLKGSLSFRVLREVAVRIDQEDIQIHTGARFTCCGGFGQRQGCTVALCDRLPCLCKLYLGWPQDGTVQPVNFKPLYRASSTDSQLRRRLTAERSASSRFCTRADQVHYAHLPLKI